MLLPRIHTMSSPDSDAQDLKPISASPTDVAPLGHPSPKPLHERTAAEALYPELVVRANTGLGAEQARSTERGGLVPSSPLTA